jgi:hypothetical protein
MAMKSNSGKAGTGHETSFGQMEGETVVPTVDANGDPRQNFTRRVFSTVAAPTTFADHCAGGNKKRFESLLRSPGRDTKPDDWDQLPGVTP